jgi:hypothetical protein
MGSFFCCDSNLKVSGGIGAASPERTGESASRHGEQCVWANRMASGLLTWEMIS